MNADPRLRLSIMMFLQYMIWGSWAVSIGGYMSKTLGFSGVEVGAVYSSTAIAAIFSPIIVGIVADRFVNTEYLLAGLHFVGGLLLTAAAFTGEFAWLYPIMITYSLFYMPTLALTNSISFANIENPEQDFPRIRVLGTWGWIFAGWIVGFVLDRNAGTSNLPILFAAAASFCLAGFSFYLPSTPPRLRANGGVQPAAEAGAGEGAEPVEKKATGEGVLKLLRDPSFAVFIACSFLICMPLAFYYGFANIFLQETDAPFPTALQTIGQLSEVGFMTLMPYFIVRLGVKRMLMVGMLAWVLRYVCFGVQWFPASLFGLFLHGVCYDFFFVASQIYVDNRVSADQRASAQSFVALVTLGFGMFLGSMASGAIVSAYGPVQVDVTHLGLATRAPLPEWNEEATTPFAQQAGLAKGASLALQKLPETITLVEPRLEIARDNFIAAVTAADADGNKVVTRAEWIAAESLKVDAVEIVTRRVSKPFAEWSSLPADYTLPIGSLQGRAAEADVNQDGRLDEKEWETLRGELEVSAFDVQRMPKTMALPDWDEAGQSPLCQLLNQQAGSRLVLDGLEKKLPDPVSLGKGVHVTIARAELAEALAVLDRNEDKLISQAEWSAAPSKFTVPAVQVTTERTKAMLPAWTHDRDSQFAIALKLRRKGDEAAREKFTADDLPVRYVETDAETGSQTIYERSDLEKALFDKGGADRDGDDAITAAEVVKSRRNDWFYIWMWPALAAGATSAAFWFGFKDQRNRQLEAEMAADAPLGAGEGMEPQVG
jgi:nucleoside transporter